MNIQKNLHKYAKLFFRNTGKKRSDVILCKLLGAETVERHAAKKDKFCLRTPFRKVYNKFSVIVQHPPHLTERIGIQPSLYAQADRRIRGTHVIDKRIFDTGKIKCEHRNKHRHTYTERDKIDPRGKQRRKHEKGGNNEHDRIENQQQPFELFDKF